MAENQEPALPLQSSPAELELKIVPDELNLVPLPEPTAPAYQLPLAPAEAVKPILPPLEMPASDGALFSAVRVRVKKFRFTGNHAFSSGELERLVAKYEGREISAEELEQARRELCLHYVSHGYINSGAVLEDQDIEGGVITFRLVEGGLTEINVSGNFWFRGYWLRHEIRRAAGKPLNFNKLKEKLQLLRQNPGITRINGEVKPGGKAGESILDLQVKEEHPFRLSTELSNHRPPSVGAEIAEIHAADLNLSGHNDPLEITCGVAHSAGTGIGDGWEYSGDKNLEGSYSFPIAPWGTTLEVRASKSDSAIIEQPFNLLNINSDLKRYGATIRQPLVETLNNEAAFSVAVDPERSETFLFDEPFSLSAGEVNGVMDVSALRLILDAISRNQVQVVSLRSTVSIGLSALGATHDNGSTRDSEFLSWVGQAQYVRRLWNTDNLCIVRLNAQLANDALLALEQFSIGGAYSVRGYRENQILRDNGVFGSLEFHLPVFYSKKRVPVLAVAPFFDVATGWNAVRPLPFSADGQENSPSQQSVCSAGIGLLFTPSKNINAQIYWGYGFNRDQIVKNGNNLQDYGLHFALTCNVF